MKIKREGDSFEALAATPGVCTYRAADVAAAIAEAEAELGPVTVLLGRRLRRGGIGGVFAEDLGVEILVRPEQPAAGTPATAPATPRGASFSDAMRRAGLVTGTSLPRQPAMEPAARPPAPLAVEATELYDVDQDSDFTPAAGTPAPKTARAAAPIEWFEPAPVRVVDPSALALPVAAPAPSPPAADTLAWLAGGAAEQVANISCPLVDIEFTSELTPGRRRAALELAHRIAGLGRGPIARGITAGLAELGIDSAHIDVSSYHSDRDGQASADAAGYQIRIDLSERPTFFLNATVIDLTVDGEPVAELAVANLPSEVAGQAMSDGAAEPAAADEARGSATRQLAPDRRAQPLAAQQAPAPASRRPAPDAATTAPRHEPATTPPAPAAALARATDLLALGVPSGVARDCATRQDLLDLLTGLMTSRHYAPASGVSIIAGPGAWTWRVADGLFDRVMVLTRSPDSGLPELPAGAARRLRHASVPTAVVAPDKLLEPPVLAQLAQDIEASEIRVVIDAAGHTNQLRDALRIPGRVVVDLVNTDESERPCAALGLGLSIVSVDGCPANERTWAQIILRRLARNAASRQHALR